MTGKQMERLDDLTNRAESLLEEFEEMDDPDRADIEQRQGVERAIKDLKKAGASMGRANANRFMDEAETRLDGIERTMGL